MLLYTTFLFTDTAREDEPTFKPIKKKRLPLVNNPSTRSTFHAVDEIAPYNNGNGVEYENVEGVQQQLQHQLQQQVIMSPDSQIQSVEII